MQDNKFNVLGYFMIGLVFIFIFCQAGFCAEESAEARGAPSGIMTVDFRDADIQNVLRLISLESGVNIVAGKDVRGTVTMRLVNVPWEIALDTVLKTHGYAYERAGNVITIDEVRSLTEQKKAEVELFEVQPLAIEVFKLKYLNAGDVGNAILPLLSKRGSVAVLYRRGPKGWGYSRLGLTKGESIAAGAGAAAAASRISAGVAMMRATDKEKEPFFVKESLTSEEAMSKTLIVTDIPPYVEKIKKTIESMDTMPKEIFIETRIVEVKRDKLRDMGVDLSTGTVSQFQLNPYKLHKGAAVEELGAASYSDNNVPQPFTPLSSGADGISGKANTATKLFNTGLNLVYRKLTGFQFEAIIHALEEDVNANVLSAPKIRTLDNQEASILIGTKYPILKSEVTTAGGTATAVTSAELDYYQDIGIQLLVVPQVNADGYINMIVHPIVSNISGYVSANIGAGTTPIQYPIIQAREAQTQVLLKSGETIAIGGLLKDAKSKGREGIPFLKDIPLLGFFFGRDTNDVEKIDLLIFITAHILEEDQEMAAREDFRYEESKQIDKVYELEAKKKARKFKKTP
jgi:type IV pilus assembly protein PilQ